MYNLLLNRVMDSIVPFKPFLSLKIEIGELTSTFEIPFDNASHRLLLLSK